MASHQRAAPIVCFNNPHACFVFEKYAAGVISNAQKLFQRANKLFHGRIIIAQCTWGVLSFTTKHRYYNGRQYHVLFAVM